MERAIRVLNELQAQGYITTYAIGGGMAVIFYAEPILTFDLDIYVLLPPSESELTTLTPIYDYLSPQGYAPQGEQIVIEGTPVQMIPAYNPLVEEAVRNAIEINYQEERTRIVRVEHLIAILLQTYRPKDRQRITLLLEQATIDEEALESLLRMYNLEERWQDFRRRYL